MTHVMRWVYLLSDIRIKISYGLSPQWSLLALLSLCLIFVKSLQLIWRSGTCRFHLRVPDLQMSCRDLTTWQGTRIVAPTMATRVTCSIVRAPMIFLWMLDEWSILVDCLVLFSNRSRSAVMKLFCKNGEDLVTEVLIKYHSSSWSSYRWLSARL